MRSIYHEEVKVNGTYSVFEDSMTSKDISAFLSSRGDPRGECMMLARRIFSDPDTTAEELAVMIPRLIALIPRFHRNMIKKKVCGLDCTYVPLGDYWDKYTPLTNAEWNVYSKATGKNKSAKYDHIHPEFEYDSHPVVGVSYNDIEGYIEYKNEITRKEGIDTQPVSYYEALASTASVDGRTYPWGNEDPTDDHVIWSGGKFPNRTHTEPADSCQLGAGPFGSLGKAGNVWYWTRTSKSVKLELDPHKLCMLVREDQMERIAEIKKAAK